MLIKFFHSMQTIIVGKSYIPFLSVFFYQIWSHDHSAKKKVETIIMKKPPTNNMQISFTYILSAFWLSNWLYQFLWRFCCNKELILATSLGRLGTDEVLTTKQPFKDGNREVKKAIRKELIGALRRGEGKI